MRLVFECSTKLDGNMSVKWENEEVALENRKKWLTTLGITPDECVRAHLALGTEFKIVGIADRGKAVEEVDALITSDLGLGLFMVVGDCFPVAIFDPVGRLALIHLGYHGIVGNLLSKVIEQLRSMGSRVEDLHMNIGPGVKKESYVFPPEEVQQRGVAGWGEFLDTHADGKVGIDLSGYLMIQARDLGIKHIEISSVDTITNANYFSHYRSKRITGEPEGRIAAVAMMR